ncbi:uncharacterized protein LOC134528039 isoform X2 [Bacillus rossius redtenbacheri]
MSDAEDGLSSPPKKVCIQQSAGKHRAQKFRKEWLSETEFKEWLLPVHGDEYKAKCKFCGITLVTEISNLKRHATGGKHTALRMSATVRQTSISRFIAAPKVDLDKEVASAEIKLSAFIAEHNVAFSVADHLTAVIKDIFYDHKIAQKLTLKRTKTCSIVNNVIAADHKEKLANKLKNTKFSILTDESTDIGTIKMSCIVVRYHDFQSGRIESKFWELREIFDSSNKVVCASAENLFRGLVASITEFGIPLENVIGFGADGCNVMMGEHNSVSSRLKEACPGIVVVKCICHSAHLCASEACKVLPRSCEDMAREIYNFLKSSAKRQSELKEFQKFLDMEPLKMLHPSQTRWLSLVAVVQRILEQWDALKLYFTDCWLSQRLLSAENIFNALHDPFLKLYFMFLSWVLPKFTKFNEFFQTKNVVITELHTQLRDLYTDILLSFMKRDYVMKTPLEEVDPALEKYHLPDTEMYLGVKVLQHIDKPEITSKPDIRCHFFHRCRTFLTVAAQEIRKRYNMNDPVLSKLSYLQPKAALSPVFRVNCPSLLPLVKVVPRIVSCDDDAILQRLDDQWRELPFSRARLPEDIDDVNSPDIFWNMLLKPSCDTQEAHFKELATFALHVLSLPHSNADCERVFSQV